MQRGVWTVAADKRKGRLKTNARHLLTCIWSVSIDVEAKVQEELRVVEGHLQLLAVLPKNKSLYQFQWRLGPDHFVTGGNAARTHLGAMYV